MRATVLSVRPSSLKLPQGTRSARLCPTDSAYSPGSSTHAEAASSNDAMSESRAVNSSTCASPGASSRVFSKPTSARAGFSSRPAGAAAYSCATALPGTGPRLAARTRTVTASPSRASPTGSSAKRA